MGTGDFKLQKKQKVVITFVIRYYIKLSLDSYHCKTNFLKSYSSLFVRQNGRFGAMIGQIACQSNSQQRVNRATIMVL